MNIFVVDEDPYKSGFSLCNKHVVKMPLETAQLLCSSVSLLSKIETPYKKSFINHPCTIWTRRSSDNFEWLLTHGFAICDAYFTEYGKQHKAREVIDWCSKNKPNKDLFEAVAMTDRPKCMPDYCKLDSVVDSYRNYYRKEKIKFAKWNKREVPKWMGE